MIRTPQALIPYALALACIAAGSLWHLAGQASPDRRVVSAGIAQVGGPFSLTDQNGAARTDADFRGRWMLIYFGYTNCPDVCPVTLALMSEALKQLGSAADRVVPVFITLDPRHDTPKVMKFYLASFDRRFVGLTGSSGAIAKVASEYRVYSVRRPLSGGAYAIDHSSVICLMGPDGKFVTAYDGAGAPETIAADMRRRL
ncbi:MAG: SCO family protein [Alphaproteobacteria bacterium]|nr:SCO family protein [Alphaproteobacteria bacterium]